MSILPQSILVVEDEPLILMDTLDLVIEEGFSAFEAYNADQALLILEQHSEIDLLFTDIDMPGTMDGLMLAQLVRQRWPHIAIVVVSGRHVPTDMELPHDGQFLPKPYRRSAILRALKQALVV